MRIYELLKALFIRPGQRPPSVMSTPGAVITPPPAAAVISADRHAYIAKHLAEIDKEVALFAQYYPIDFNAFLYRPATADFVRRQALPLKNGDVPTNNCLNDSHWLEKHYLNFPGPFYTGESDTCGTGDGEAPANVLYDSHCCEYVFRQPQSFAEFLCVLDAAAVEVLNSYSCDGNDHWTVALCRDWWRSKSKIIGHLNTAAFQETNGSRTQLYVDYLNGPAETDLRRYCYFLENGTYPASEDVTLPSL